jgi:hypothetical protein
MAVNEEIGGLVSATDDVTRSIRNSAKLTVEGQGDGLERHVRQSDIETSANGHWDHFFSVNEDDHMRSLVKVWASVSSLVVMRDGPIDRARVGPSGCARKPEQGRVRSHYSQIIFL